MLPREHGAYGQLLFPLATAIAMGTPTAAAMALAFTAIVVFLVHEPALVLLGVRGVRARRDDGARATRWLVRLSTLAVASGLIAIWSMPTGLRWTLIVPMAAAAIALHWTLRGQERTTVGEVTAGLALSAAAFPVGAAAGVALPAAAGCVVAFSIGVIAATLSVRALIGRARGRPRAPAPGGVILWCGALLAGSGTLAMVGLIDVAGFWGALPMTAAALAIVLVAPPPALLRRVGWTLVAATALAAAVLVLAS